MNKFLGLAGRVLLSQIFLLQVAFLVNGFLNSPTGYADYQAGLGSHGLPGLFAPLIVLIQFVGGLALLLGYKTKVAAIFMAIYALFIAYALGLPPLQYLAIVGGLLMLASQASFAFSLDNLKHKQ